MFARHKSECNKHTMKNTAPIYIVLLLAICFLSACTSKQAPTQLGESNVTGLDDVIVSGNGDQDWSASLEPREYGGEISGDKFGEFTTVPGILPSVYFGFDSSSIAATERMKLQEAADYLKENPKDHVLIEGYCDWYGTSEYNLALGDRRATSASNYLNTLGVDSQRIEQLSKGSLEATANLSKSESGQDRRVDLILLQK